MLRGKVKSSQANCRINREVGVYRSVNGGGFNRYGTLYSDSYGLWSLGKPNGVPPGKYYAQVETKNNCKPDYSKVVTVN